MLWPHPVLITPASCNYIYKWGPLLPVHDRDLRAVQSRSGSYPHAPCPQAQARICSTVSLHCHRLLTEVVPWKYRATRSQSAFIMGVAGQVCPLKLVTEAGVGWF